MNSIDSPLAGRDETRRQELLQQRKEILKELKELDFKIHEQSRKQ